MIRVFLLSIALTVSAAAQDGRIVPFLMGSGALSTEWSQRVVANGGALPSQNTINAMETFRLGIIADGLSNKMLSVCIFVPDSLIAATTPIFKAQGSDPWVNHNFAITNLTVDGLQGDGTSKYLDTGIIARNAVIGGDTTGGVGLTALVDKSYDNANGVELGHCEAAFARPLLLLVSTTYTTSGQTAFWDAAGDGANIAFISDYRRSGVVSANAIGTNMAIYTQTPLVGFRTLTVKTNVGPIISLSTNETIFAFCYNAAGTPTGYSGKRLSAEAVTDGLTSAEAALFANRLLAVRTALGGGTGDEVSNWANSVTNYGSTVSEATKSVLRTAYTSLEPAALLTNSAALNFIVPDNVIAACMPLVWQAGSERWTNFFFGSTNLTVNGLTGDGSTKYLNTGIIPSTIPANVGVSSTSVGLSTMVVQKTTPANPIMGAQPSATSAYFALFDIDAAMQFNAWSYDGVSGQNFINFGPPGTNGWISGNRTAANAIAIYTASTNVAFHAAATGSAAQSGSITTTHPVTVFAFNEFGTVKYFTTNTLSFVGITAGFTSAQSSNLYYIVSTARTGLGGGNP